MSKLPTIRLVVLESESYKSIERLIKELPLFGVLPLRASEIEELFPGIWRVELLVASFLKEKELNLLISMILRKEGEEK